MSVPRYLKEDDPIEDYEVSGETVVHRCAQQRVPVEPGIGVAGTNGRWHSTVFTWDGAVIVAGWEPGGGAEDPVHHLRVHAVALLVPKWRRATGIDAGPEGGCGLAVLHRLVQEQRLDGDTEVVLFNTGSGASYRQ